MTAQEIIAQCQILEIIYESPNSMVYRGISLGEPRQPVVLKVLKDSYPTAHELTRYRQEFHILQQFDRDDIIKAYAIETYGRGLVIVLEDFGGMTLKSFIPSTLPPLKLCLEIGIKLVETLSYIHQKNIIHKDINPSNVLIHPQTQAIKLIDFGISTQLSRENPLLKNPEVLEGTLAYISPEQTGRMNRSLDYRTDFYSFGVLLYEILTGRLPFIADDPLEMVHAHLAIEPPPPESFRSDIPKPLSAIVLKLLTKSAEDRYQSALGIQADLAVCLEQLTTTGTVTPFSLGNRDVSDRFQIPQKLYGREAEIDTLLSAFDRVTTGKSATEMMLVAGYSGIGKSSLVAEIHKPITAKRGYFLTGKFDQYQRNIPYSAVVSAFSDLIKQLLTENASRLDQWRTTLLEQLSPNAQVMIEVIPGLEKVLGSQPAVTPLRPTEAQNRFNLVFLKFLEVFCTPDHPLVIFLDDLQWADSASLKLIELIMTHSGTQSLLLLGAYRDNEVSPTHPFLLLIDFLRQSGVVLHEIVLSPLNQVQLEDLIGDTLHHDRVNIKLLGELVLQKTKGNPFFVNEFLRSLYAEGLLYFEADHRRWEWSLDKIKACNTTDNVVELLITQLQKLPPIVQERLKVAACLGAKFEVSTLGLVGNATAQQVFADLIVPMQWGLLVPLSELSADLVIESLRFSHDRIQQSAYAMIPETDRPLVHGTIGRLLWQRIPPIELQERIFEVIDHLNEGLLGNESNTDRLEIALLNLQAGKKARLSTAFTAALKYFQTGLGLLPEGSWQSNYGLILELHEEAIETAFLCHDLELREQLSQIVLHEARSVLDTIRVYRARILSCSSRNLHLEATTVGLEVLVKLGFEFPQNSDTFIQAALDQTAQLYTTETIEALIALPTMTAPTQLAAMAILSDILSSGYQAVFDRFIWSNLQQIRLSLLHGNTQESAFAYACYGITLCGVTGKIEAGYRFGRLALEVVEKFHARETQSRVQFVFNAFVRHWQEPLQDSIPSLLEGYQVALETGDLEYACYSLCWNALHSLLTGQELCSLATQMANFRQTISSLKQAACLVYMQIFQQVVADLSDTPGEQFIAESTFLADFQHNKLALAFYFTLHCFVHYLYGRYDRSLTAATAAYQVIDGMTASATVPLLNCYYSLALLAQADLEPNADRSAILTTVTHNQQQLHHWASHAPHNHQHHYLLVEAEKQRVAGASSAAMEAYELALQAARQSRHFHEEAIICERAGKFYLTLDRLQFAKVYLQDAHYGYRCWGANGKLRHLELDHPGLFHTSALFSNTITTSTTARGQLLDLTSVLRSSQAIAQEIVCDKLLITLLQILITSAGAQRGYLLLEADEEYTIEASLDIQTQQNTVLQSLDPTGKVPLGVVNFVCRTSQEVVLSHASQEGSFTTDPYIQIHQSKSILCAPLINQGKISAIIYLENNLVPGAFTADRLEILQLLSGQAAIAIDNARLYAHLEQKVADRTQALTQTLEELRATQHELVQSEKMAALGQLIAGIAHEINTPMGAINASIGNIFTAMDQSIIDLPQVFRLLSPSEQDSFLQLVQALQQPRPNLSTREERQVRRTLTTALEAVQIPHAPSLASALVNLGIITDDPAYLPLWQSAQCELVLRAARNLAVQRNNGENIKLAVEKASKIVYALKTYAHRGTGDKKVLANLHQTIEVVLTIYHNLIKQGIETSVEAEEIPEFYCYPDALGQVWTNLIHNAIQAMDGKGSLKIKLYAMGGDAVVEISDSGKGIPPDVQPRIFEAFYTTKAAGEGSGLGLHIAQEIIAKHQGTLSFTSVPGCTTFRVSLPMQTQ